MVESLEERIKTTLAVWSTPDPQLEQPLTEYEQLLLKAEQREHVADLAKAVFAAAVQDVLLDDSPENLVAVSPRTRDEILAYKTSAWYWFFGFPCSDPPRWSLEQVCLLIGRDPEIERSRIRRLAREPLSGIPPAMSRQLAELGPRNQPLGPLKRGVGRRRVAA